jgi:hypothetical protein
VTLSQEHQQFTPSNEPTVKFHSAATVKFQPVVPPPFVPPPAHPPVQAPAPQVAAAPPVVPAIPTVPAAPAVPPAPAAPAAAAPKPAPDKPYVPRSAARRLARKILGPSLLTKRG